MDFRLSNNNAKYMIALFTGIEFHVSCNPWMMPLCITFCSWHKQIRQFLLGQILGLFLGGFLWGGFSDEILDFINQVLQFL